MHADHPNRIAALLLPGSDDHQPEPTAYVPAPAAYDVEPDWVNDGVSPLAALAWMAGCLLLGWTIFGAALAGLLWLDGR